ncbi:hypothetical protein R0K04_23260, partial [Pseudoalteromonas sp. SIMBA_153]
DAQGSKANLARLADRVTAIFVPVVVTIALVTFGVTWWLTGMVDTALMHAVSVLVIACPCALGLATPAAIIARAGDMIMIPNAHKHVSYALNHH